MIGNRCLVPIKIQVQRIEHEDKLRQVDRWICDYAQSTGLTKSTGPIVQVGFSSLTWLPGGHDQRERRAQHEKNRECHRQQHVADHVHRECRRNNHADARTHNHRHAQ